METNYSSRFPSYANLVAAHGRFGDAILLEVALKRAADVIGIRVSLDEVHSVEDAEELARGILETPVQWGPLPNALYRELADLVVGLVRGVPQADIDQAVDNYGDAWPKYVVGTTLKEGLYQLLPQITREVITPNRHDLQEILQGLARAIRPLVAYARQPTTSFQVVYEPAGEPIPLQEFTTDWGSCFCRDAIDPAAGAKVVMTTCRHVFHEECLNKWVNESAQANSHTCPNCLDGALP